MDVQAVRRRVLNLADRETEARATLVPLEAAAGELGREVEELKLAADRAKEVLDRVKSEIDQKKSQGVFTSNAGERSNQQLEGALLNAKRDLEDASDQATAKRRERAEAKLVSVHGGKIDEDVLRLSPGFPLTRSTAVSVCIDD